MTVSRLRLAGPTSTKSWILIHLFLPQYVEGGFGQMSRHCSNRFGMSLPLAQPPVQLADVPLRMAFVIDRHRVGRFGKGPLQISIHVRAQRSVAHFPAAGVHARRGSRVAGQVHGTRKSLHFSDLQGDRRSRSEEHTSELQSHVN